MEQGLQAKARGEEEESVEVPAGAGWAETVPEQGREGIVSVLHAGRRWRIRRVCPALQLIALNAG